MTRARVMKNQKISKLRIHLLFSILFILLLVCSVQAAQTIQYYNLIYDVKINVKDSINNTPISGATVSVDCLYNPSFDCSYWGGVTQESGQYYKSTAHVGLKENISSVRITISKSGYDDWSKTIPATFPSGYVRIMDKLDVPLVNKNPSSVLTTLPTTPPTVNPTSYIGYLPQETGSSDVAGLIFSVITGIIVISGVAVGCVKLKSKMGKQAASSELSIHTGLPEISLPAGEDIPLQIVITEKEASTLEFFKRHAMAIVGQAKAQYTSGAFDSARTTLSTAERVIAALRQKEEQMRKWKSEGYDTSVLENLSNENIISVNSAYQDYEQMYPLLKKYNICIKRLKQDSQYDGADPEINNQISNLELKAKDPRNLAGIDEEITTIQKTMQDYHILADERIRSARKKVKIFISSKSEDYRYAEQVYIFLTSHGYQVFFSKESLPRMGNSEYLREIDNAIEAAKHMIVVTSKREFVESQWVSAEWAAFINEKRSARKSGNLVVLLGGTMKIEDLPISLRQYETRFLEDPNTLEQILNYLM